MLKTLISGRTQAIRENNTAKSIAQSDAHNADLRTNNDCALVSCFGEQIVFSFRLSNAPSELFIELNSYDDIAAFRPIDPELLRYPTSHQTSTEGQLEVRVALAALETFFTVLDDELYHGTCVRFTETFVLADDTGTERSLMTESQGAPTFRIARTTHKTAIRRFWDRITGGAK